MEVLDCNPCIVISSHSSLDTLTHRGYIPYDNIHEINPWQCPIQTQQLYAKYSRNNLWKVTD